MTLGALHEDSVVARCVRASLVCRFLTDADGIPACPLKRSVVVRMFASVPALQRLLSVLAVVVGTAGVVAGDSVLTLLAVVFLLGLHRPVWTLALTPALLIWGPKLNLAVMGDEAFFFRLDQAAIAGMLVAAAIRNREAPVSPPAHAALLLFLMALPLSVVAGVGQGTLETGASAVLYLGQWLTWYALLLAASTFGHALGGRAVYAWALPLIALAAYGLTESLWPLYAESGVRYRIFERGYFPGQANHVGGLLALATVTGLALARERRFRVLGFVLALGATAALPATGSRSGMVAWTAGIAAWLLLRRPALRWWLPPLGVAAFFALPPSLGYRLSAPGSSMYDRLVAWKSALSTLPDYPLLGLGAGARHRSYYDSQYLMTLAESGAVGLVLLLCFLVLLAVALNRSRALGQSPLAAGATAGVVVLAVHGLATASLVVTLVGGPFFWLCGVAGSATEEARS